MADKKITALAAATSTTTADVAHLVTGVATNPTNKKITVANFWTKIPGFIGLSGLETKTGAGAISVTVTLTNLITEGAVANALANGIQGQLKVIVFITDGGDSVLTPATMNDGTTLTFADAGDAAMLMYIGAAGWALIGQAGPGTPGAGPTVG